MLQSERVEKFVDLLSPAKEDVLLEKKVAGRNVRQLKKKAVGDVSRLGHLLLILAFFGALGVLVGFTIYDFVTQPRLQTTSIAYANQFGPLPVLVSVTCETADTPFGCGTVLITTNYSTTDPCGAANVQNGDQIIVPQPSPGAQPEVLQFFLCPTLDGEEVTISQPIPLATRGLIIEFSNFSVGALASIVLQSPSGNAGGGSSGSGSAASFDNVLRLHRSLGVFDNSVKSFNLGLLVEQNNGQTTSLLLYENSFQLEGSRVDLRSDVVIRVNPFATVHNTASQMTVGELIGGIGSSKELVETCFLVLIPIWTAYFMQERVRPMTRRASSMRSAAHHPPTAPPPGDTATSNHNFTVSHSTVVRGFDSSGDIPASPVTPQEELTKMPSGSNPNAFVVQRHEQQQQPQPSTTTSNDESGGEDGNRSNQGEEVRLAGVREITKQS